MPTSATPSPDAVHRPWGFFEVLRESPDYKVKLIVVRPGQRLSLQRHARRQEHWFVISGQALAWVDERPLRLDAGASVEIAASAWHRLCNEAAHDLVLCEVQTGGYFGEDDIERREDDYGRLPTAG